MAIPFLTNDQMHEITQEVLRRYHPQDTLPVPIEEIIELQLKLDIVPTPGLLKGFEIDGFLTRDFSSIYVDDFVQSNRPTRYRFTLAHEVGHLILHKELLEGLATFETWIPGRSLSGTWVRIKTVTNIRVMLLRGFSWFRNTT